MVGRRRECGVGVLETLSWKSGGGSGVDAGDDDDDGGENGEGGGVGVTTSSRHWGELRWIGPVGLLRGWEELGMVDWKAWMGRASKNSWANMNGILEGSRASFYQLDEG